MDNIKTEEYEVSRLTKQRCGITETTVSQTGTSAQESNIGHPVYALYKLTSEEITIV